MKYVLYCCQETNPNISQKTEGNKEILPRGEEERTDNICPQVNRPESFISGLVFCLTPYHVPFLGSHDKGHDWGPLITQLKSDLKPSHWRFFQVFPKPVGFICPNILLKTRVWPVFTGWLLTKIKARVQVWEVSPLDSCHHPCLLCGFFIPLFHCSLQMPFPLFAIWYPYAFFPDIFPTHIYLKKWPYPSVEFKHQNLHDTWAPNFWILLTLSKILL